MGSTTFGLFIVLSRGKCRLGYNYKISQNSILLDLFIKYSLQLNKMHNIGRLVFKKKKMLV